MMLTRFSIFIIVFSVNRQCFVLVPHSRAVVYQDVYYTSIGGGGGIPFVIPVDAVDRHTSEKEQEKQTESYINTVQRIYMSTIWISPMRREEPPAGPSGVCWPVWSQK